MTKAGTESQGNRIRYHIGRVIKEDEGALITTPKGLGRWY
jgi:hypothetical protein